MTMDATERARMLAVAELVERWAPGVEAVAVDATIAVATGQMVDGVLRIDCTVVEHAAA